MARRKRRKKQKYSQEALLVLTGAILTLCVLSITYGFLIRRSLAEETVREFRIEVLNGTGEQGVAQKVAMAIMEKGVDVFSVGNADRFDYPETILIGRKKKDGLDELGKALGCRNVIEQTAEDSFVDATLILGADYRKLKLGK